MNPEETGKNKKIERLTELFTKVIKGNGNKQLFEAYKSDIDAILPRDVITILDKIMKSDIGMEELKSGISKVLNVVHLPLKKLEWKPKPENYFLTDMVSENTELRKILDKLKEKLKVFKPEKTASGKLESEKSEIRSAIKKAGEINIHYLKKENILFPYLEKYWEDFGCLSVMWSIHDDVRKYIKELDVLLQNDMFSTERFNNIAGKFFFSLYAMIFREELILYPAAEENLGKKLWEEMHRESFGIGFSYIKSSGPGYMSGESLVSGVNEGFVDLGTGMLSPDQVIMIFNTLPVDITFVDEKNRVAYFSSPKERIFTRSKAVIGREVQNCHPPESLHIVNKIINSFRDGTRESENFWIEMKGKTILIQYFAVRNGKGEYKGTLEISSDISNIKKTEGEKRLLDY